MFPSRRSRLVLALALVTGVNAAVAPHAVAHPPQAPFDTTHFAPITNESGGSFDLAKVADGFIAPNKAVAAPGQPGLLYVVDQPGQLWGVDLNRGTKSLVLDVKSRLMPLGLGAGKFDERGLLGVAFHPNFAVNGLLYTYTSEPVSGAPSVPTTLAEGQRPDHQNVVAEWRIPTPRIPMARVDVATRRDVLRMDWPQFNHNAGDLAFGPDGYLYIATGDGGGSDDTGVGHQVDGNAQKLNNPLGKILRIDPVRRAGRSYQVPQDNPFVGTADALGEIWAYGLRNPFRFSFDKQTGDLYAGDVGQNDIEEVNKIVKGGNYGWNTKEGTLFFHPNGGARGTASLDDNGRVPPGVVDPIAQYDLHHEGHSVIGGYVYRGTRFPAMSGKLVFGEWSRIFRFAGPYNNWGRLLYIDLAEPAPLKTIHEMRGFADVAHRQGLHDGTQPDELWLEADNPSGVLRPTLSVLGIGQDAAGEVYVLGNMSGSPHHTESDDRVEGQPYYGPGSPFYKKGVVLRLTPPQT